MAGVQCTVAVRMFGPLRLEVAGNPIGRRDLGGVKPKQLLEILLLERGRPVPKDRLADLLWGENLPQHVMATIETYVSLLRRKLDVEPGLGRRLIVTEHGGYRVATEELAVDLDQFEPSSSSAPLPPSSLSAARRWTRRPSWAGTSCWPTNPTHSGRSPRASTTAPARVQALVDLAECCLELADHRAAITAAEQVLALEPTSERAYRTAMHAHEALGDRDEALRTYLRWRTRSWRLSV